MSFLAKDIKIVKKNSDTHNSFYPPIANNGSTWLPGMRFFIREETLEQLLHEGLSREEQIRNQLSKTEVTVDELSQQLPIKKNAKWQDDVALNPINTKNCYEVEINFIENVKS